MLEVHPGFVFDVASSLDDLVVLYRKKGTVEASFKDPNAVEEELKAIAEAEKEKRLLDEKKVQDVKDKKSTKRSIESDGSEEARKEFSPKSVAPSSGEWKDDEIHSESFTQLEHTLDNMLRSKGDSARGRNTWQARQMGGQGDPFYRDSAGFDVGIGMTIEHGRAVFREKWGHRDCDIRAIGLRPEDAWRLEHDWD